MMIIHEERHELITVAEAADYLKVDRVTVWRWCNTGKLPAVKFGRSWRIDRRSLNRMIEDSLERISVN